MARPSRQPIVYATVPRLWPDSTIVCLGGGPSLVPADVDACRGRAHVIAVNDAYRLAPWADVLYAADKKWWRAHPKTAACQGLKYGLQSMRTRLPSGDWSSDRPDVELLRISDTRFGIDSSPDGLCVGGGNSGYQAVNLAVHLGASRILLLGYDLQLSSRGKAHWFGSHVGMNNPTEGRLIQWRHYFASLVAPLAARGIHVINCSRETALTCFPRQALSEALPAASVAA